MEYRQLGRNGPTVSVIGLGCFAFGGDRQTGTHLGNQMESLHKGVWGEQSDKDTFETVKAALDVGINLFDTAEMYGNGYSEEILGKALKASGYPRDKYMIATKVCENYLSKDLLRQHLQQSLDRLGVDYIDIYQIHWHSRAAVKTTTYPERPLRQEIPLEETMKELANLQEGGKIKYIAVCNFGPQDIQEILRIGVPIISNQLPYSLLWRNIENSANGNEPSITTICEQNGIGIMAWGCLMQGLLCDKYTTADDVPSGRARNRLFSNQRPQQRHGEKGLETETFATVDAIRKIVASQQKTDSSTSMAQMSLSWILQQSNVTNIGTVLMGARNENMLTANALPAIKHPLPKSTVQQLNDATNELRVKLGTNLDPYESQANTRIL